MKRYLEYFFMALGIPVVYRTLAFIALVTLFAFCCGCSSEEVIDRINGLPSDDAFNSAPQSLKPYYDADLTKKLNQ